MAAKDQKHTEKKSESKSIQKDSNPRVEAGTFQLQDNRKEHITQLKLKDSTDTNGSGLTSQVSFSDNRISSFQLKSIVNGAETAQLKDMEQNTGEEKNTPTHQLKLIQPRKVENKVVKNDSVSFTDKRSPAVQLKPKKVENTVVKNDAVSFTDKRSPAVQLKPKKVENTVVKNDAVSFTDKRSAAQLKPVLKPAQATAGIPQLKEVEEGKEEKSEQAVDGLQFTAQLSDNGDSGTSSTVQLKSNNSGLTSSLKSGVEHLSGQSMSDVKVHKNSEKPAQLNAHAYAQGSDIHVAPGQEKHIPHEAWHVAQQKQGRVKPTKQLKGKTNINDDEGLEREADVMGAKALRFGEAAVQRKFSPSAISSTVQRVGETPEAAPAAEGTYSYTEPGFVIDTGSMRNAKLVSAIIKERGTDEEKSKKIESGGGTFARLTGGSFKLQKELDPKKLGFYVPVKFDGNSKNKIDKWVPTTIDYKSPHLETKDAAKLTSMGFASEGYFDSKKAIKSKLNLIKKEGIKINDEDNDLNKAVNSSFLARGASALINSSVTVRGVVNNGLETGITKVEDAAEKGLKFINEKAKKEVAILKDISFGLDKGATRVTPLGSIITVQGGYKNYGFSTTFKVNTHSDYSSEYMGSVVNVPKLTLGSKEKVLLEIDPGEFIHDPDATSNVIQSNNGSMTLGILGQQASVKWSSLGLDVSDNSIAGAIDSFGILLELFGSKADFEVQNPEILDNGLKFSKATGNIDQINPMPGLSFTELTGSIIEAGESYDLAASGTVTIDLTEAGVSGGGKASLTKEGSAEAHLGMSEGQFSAKILGQEFNATDVNFSSSDNSITAGQGTVIVKIDNPAGVNVEGEATVFDPKIIQGVFTYSGAKATFPTIELPGGVKFSDVTGELIKGDDGDQFSASAKFEVPEDIVKSSGEVSILKEDEEVVYELNGGTFEATVFDGVIRATEVAYDSESNVFSAAQISGDVELGAPFYSTLEVLALNPTLTDGAFTFEEAKVTLGSMEPMPGVEFSDVTGTVKEVRGGFVYDARGKFNITKDPITKSSGDVIVGFSEENEWFVVRNGQFEADVMGSKLKASDINYSFANNPDLVTSSKVSVVGIKFFGSDFKLEVTEASFSADNGFDFKSAEINLGDINSDILGVSFTNIDATIGKDKKGEALYEGKADLKFEKGSITSEAEVNVGLSASGPFAYIRDGSFNAEVFGQTVEVAGIKYSSSSAKSISADSAAVSFKISTPAGGEINGDATVIKPRINSEGFSYDKAGVTVTSEIDLGYGIKFKDISGELTKEGEEDHFVGKASLDVNHEKVTASGDIVITQTGEEAAEYTVTNGAFETKFYGATIGATNIAYHSEDNSFSADSLKGMAPVPLPEGTQEVMLEVKEPKFKDGEFSYGTITAKLNDIEPMPGVKFVEPEGKIEKVREKTVYEAKAGFEINVGPITTPAGANKKAVTIGSSGETKFFYVQNASFGGELLGGKIEASGVSYSHASNNMVKVAKASVKDIQFLDAKLSIALKKASYSPDQGFNFEEGNVKFDKQEITTPIPNLVFSGVDVTASKDGENTIVKGNAKLEYKGDSVKVSADVTLGYTEKAGTFAYVKDGTIETTILGQAFTATGIKYSIQNPKKLTAKEAKIDISLPTPSGEEVTGVASISRPRLDDIVGFSYDTAAVKFGDIDLGYGVSFKNVNGTLTKGKQDEISGKAQFKVENEKVKKAGGQVNVKQVGEEDAEFTLSNAFFNIDFFGSEVKVEGVQYNSASDELSATEFGANLKIPVPGAEVERAVDVTVTSPRLTAGKFEYDEIITSLPDPIEPMPGVQFNNTILKIRTVRGKPVYEATADFNVEDGPITSATGKVKLGSSNTGVYFLLKNGTMEGEILGGKLNATGISYSYANDNKVEVADARFDIDVFDAKLSIALTKASYSGDNGFDFETGTASFDKDEITTPIPNLVFSGLDATASKDGENTIVKGNAKLEYKGDSVKVSADVTLGYTEKAGTFAYVKDGTIETTILGQAFTATGIKYSIQNPKKLTAKEAKIDISLPTPSGEEVTGVASISRPRLDDIVGFSYDTAAVKFGDIDLGYGVSFKNVNGTLTKGKQDEISGKAQFKVENEKVKKAGGQVNVKQVGEEDAEFTLSNAFFNIDFFGSEVKVEGVQYNSASDELSATEFGANLKIPVPGAEVERAVDVTVKAPRLTAGEFEYDEITVAMPDPIEPISGVKFENVKGTISNVRGKPVYKATALFNVKAGPIESGKGVVTLGSSNTGVYFFLKNGTLDGKMLGGKLNATGISYSHSNHNKVQVADARFDIDIFDAKLSIALKNASYSDDKGFDFETGEGSFDKDEIKTPIDNLVFAGLEATALKEEDNTIVKGSGKLEYKGDSVTVNADVTLGYTQKAGTFAYVQDGTIETTILGQKFTTSGIKYSKQSPKKLTAKEAKAEISLSVPSGEELTGSVTVARPQLDDKIGFSYKKAAVKFDDIDLGYGVSFKNVNGTLMKGVQDEITGKAQFKVENEKIKKAGGQVNVSQVGEEDAALKLSNGYFNVDFFGSEVKVAGVEYDSATEELSAKEFGAKLNIPVPGEEAKRTVDVTVIAPRLTAGKFEYDEITADLPEPIEPISGVKFDGTTLKIRAVRGKPVYEATSKFTVNRDPITSSTGEVKFGVSNTGTYFLLKNGTLKGTIMGATLDASGISYSHASKNLFKVPKAKLSGLKVLGTDVAVDIKNATYSSDQGFNFESITTSIEEIAFTNDIKLNKVSITISKKGADYNVSGETGFNVGGQINGLKLATGGTVKVAKEKENPATVSLSNGSIKLSSDNQYFEMLNVNYENGVFKAGTSKADFTVPFIGSKLPVEVKDLEVSKDGYSFSEASIKPPNASISFGFASAHVSELKIEKTSEGNKISGSGGISVGGGTILGKPLPELTGTGTVSHQFKKDGSEGTTEKDLVGVAAKLPEFDLPKDLLPSGLWPVGVSFPIPVAPGVQVKIFAGVKGGLKSTDTSVSLIKKDKDTYTFGAETKGMELSVEANLGAGVEAGSPFLASVMVGLEAAGTIGAKADMKFEKDFSISGAASKMEIPATDTSSFTYKVTGGVDLAANLVFEATALYFLSKKWTKKLVEKNLGSFEKENGGEWKFKGPDQPLQSEDELMNDVSSKLPKSLKGKSKEELAALGQQKRFGKDATKDVVTKFNETENTRTNPQKLIDWGEFNYNRVDWDKLESVLPVIIENANENQTVEPEAEAEVVLNPASANPDPATPPSWFEKFKDGAMSAAETAKLELSYRSALDGLGKAVNSKSAFVDAYKNSATDLRNTFTTDDPELLQIINLHLGLVDIYVYANNDVKRSVHSSMIGDEKRQALGQIGRFFGFKGLKEKAEILNTKLPEVKTKHENVDKLQEAYMRKHATPAPATPPPAAAADAEQPAKKKGRWSF